MSSRKISRKLMKAAWVAPMTGPLVRDGAIVFRGGRVEAVGAVWELRKKYPDAEIVEMEDAVILPGLVNAHTHLELSHIRCEESSGEHLGEWIVNTVMPQAAKVPVEVAVREGVGQCLIFGVTSIGDITKQSPQTRAALRDGPLRVVSYGEITAMAKRRGFLEERFAVASDTSNESHWLRVGISPHAPYTVEPQGYRRCLEWAKSQNRPLATHLAETAEEAAFLAEHTGPFRTLWETGVNAWSDDVPRFAGGPIRFAREVGLLDYPSLLAHVNCCDDEEMEILAKGKASVVFCPRTHQFFGHPPHRWREMLKRGINVAVGTDSCASSPDLNIVDDLRLLHRKYPEEPVTLLWEMATLRGARAIGAKDSGTIGPGAVADFVVFNVSGDDPLRETLERNSFPNSVWINGQKIA